MFIVKPKYPKLKEIDSIASTASLPVPKTNLELQNCFGNMDLRASSKFTHGEKSPWNICDYFPCEVPSVDLT